MSRDGAAGVVREQERIRLEYRRRERDVDADRYAPWQPAVLAERSARLRAASRLLLDVGRFPQPTDQCLEIGYGSAGWLADLVSWGVMETCLHGIELDELRAARARQLLPAADLRVGDARRLPWSDGTFNLVVISTVVTSILHSGLRRLVCREAARVLADDGAILWYDLRRNNPANPAVRRVDARELAWLFPQCRIALRSTTLAPPLARIVTARSELCARVLEAVPWLRTHLVAVIRK